MMKIAFARAVFGITGLSFSLSGAALLGVPRWFYENMGPFAPYNRHYEGDAGAFLLPLGLATVISAYRSRFPMSLMAVVTAGAVLHTANHAFDAFDAGQPPWAGDVLPLAVMAAATVYALYLCRIAEVESKTRLGPFITTRDLGHS